MNSTFFATLISRGITATGSVLLVLWLGKITPIHMLGQFVFYYFLISISSSIARFGLETALMKNVSKYWPLKKNILFGIFIKFSGITLIHTFILSVIIYIIFYSFPQFTLIKIGYNSITLIILPIAFFSLNSMIAAVLKAANRPNISPLFESGGSDFILFIFSIIAHVNEIKLDTKYLQILYTISLFIIFAYGLYLIFHLYDFKIANFTNLDIKYDSSIIKESYNFFLINLIVLSANRGIPFIIGIGSSSEIVGTFSLLQTISSIIGFPLLVYSSILPPKFSNLYGNKDLIGLKNLFEKSKKNLVILSLPVMIAMTFFHQEIFTLFKIHTNILNTLSFLFLLISQFITIYNGPSGFLLIMCDREKFTMKATMAVYLSMITILIISNILEKNILYSAIIISLGLSTRALILALARNKIWTV